MEKEIEKSKFLNEAIARKVKELVGTPAYVYDEKSFIQQSKKALEFPN